MKACTPLNFYFILLQLPINEILLISTQTASVISLRYAHAYLVSSVFGRRNHFLFLENICLLFIYLGNAC